MIKNESKVAIRQAHYDQLCGWYIEHNYKYHVLDAPTISDDAFNEIVREIIELETQLPGLMKNGRSILKVGGKPKGLLPKVRFDKPMLSMDNIFDKDEAYKKFCPKHLVHLEPKVDGLALTLVYRGGSLIMAHTRGDGTVGEDVTVQCLTAPSIPSTIQKGFGEILEIEIRGEAYLSKDDFKRINMDLTVAGKEKLKTARNAVAGTIRNTDLKEVEYRNPKFICYDVVAHIQTDNGIEEFPFKTQLEKYELASVLGFETMADYGLECVGESSFIGYIDSLATGSERRETLPFDIDGVVIKVNSIEQQKKLGATGRVPLWAYAYKYPSMSAITTFRSVTWSMSYTGAYTPVAILDPVPLGGVVVTRASLHNLDWMNRLGVRIGDKVEIQRGGEVIPKITGVLSSSDGDHILAPEFCRYCLEPLRLLQSRPTCVNPCCCRRSQLYLTHVVGRDVLNIVGIAEETINDITNSLDITRELEDTDRIPALVGSLEELLRGEWVSRYADPNSLTWAKLTKAINDVKTRETELWRIYAACAIPEVGKSTAKLLARERLDRRPEFLEEDWDGLRRWLLTLKDIGPVVAGNIVDFFRTRPDLQWIQMLNVKYPQPITKKLEGEVYVITGSLPDGVRREELKDRIEAMGGKVTGKVTKNTTALIAGVGGGGKRKDAQRLGVIIVDAEKWLKGL